MLYYMIGILIISALVIIYALNILTDDNTNSQNKSNIYFGGKRKGY